MNKLLIILTKYKRFFVFGFFFVLIIMGFLAYQDYGLSWDEPISHINGQVTLDYVTKGDPALWTYSERYYGTIVEMPLVALTKFFGASSTQELFFIRHIATFLLFVAGVFVFYRLCLKRFKSTALALTGALFLVLSPRIFADAFYNSKDIPMMIFFIISIYTLSRFLDRPSIKNIFIHSVASALLIATRIPGIILPLITIGVVALDFILLPETKRQWRKIATLICIYLITTALITVALWPYLWKDTISHFGESYRDMKQFSRQINMQILYMGEYLTASKLPWHYIPVWMIITTPILYLALFLIGLGYTIKRFIKKIREEYRQNKLDFAVLGWFFGPILAVIIFNSVLYDGWRHLYFVYPAIIYIALLGIAALLSWIRKSEKEVQNIFQAVFFTILAVSSIGTAWFMIKNHPYQNVYFNIFAGNITKARENFDLDYWGLSFREGLEYIARNDKDPIIPIAIIGGTPDNLLMLTEEQANRFLILSQEELGKAKYILSNYRWQRYAKMPHHLEFYTVKVKGENIMSVFKLK